MATGWFILKTLSRIDKIVLFLLRKISFLPRGVSLLREAFFPIRGARKSVVRPPPFSVRKIIDFCEEDMEDGRVHVLLSTGTLNS